MAKVGIDFNFKKSYRHNWQWCMTFVGVYIFLLIGAAYLWQLTMPLTVASVWENSVIFWIPVIYYILLYNLYKRFSALNSFLRFVEIGSMKRILFIKNNNWWTSIRNQFLNESVSRRLIRYNANDSINIIKFAGHVHSQLTGMVDQLNACYSFQVLSTHKSYK